MPTTEILAQTMQQPKALLAQIQYSSSSKTVNFRGHMKQDHIFF